MARRPREDFPGSWHHVINRGISKRPLFETSDDSRFFLARLIRQIRLGRIEVHAFCLMTTHFHLLVRSPVGELSEAMRRVQNEHSRRFNRKRRRDGALIRGVYFSRSVRTLEYRRTLVRYIDSNPVKAGVVRSSADYPFCSAAAYNNESGPRWLSRTWVEAEVCSMAGIDKFTPTAYFGIFGGKSASQLEEIDGFIEARMRSRSAEDSLEDLIGSTPLHVQEWMRRKTKLADGHRLGMPVCGRLALLRALDSHLSLRGVWMIEDGRNTWRGVELARTGLLRDLCSLTWPELAQQLDSTVGRVRRIWSVHKRLLGSDTAYAGRVSEVAHLAICRSFG